ncbi:hypothetical protein FKW77_006699 [Venturia effusa]|uniref:Uncharacterized protein n=1 Tax=Venturia effusa TaxID=50376 RepID=A0A517L1H8_9PEZI|nr:hypothetical protein FKW77_006699 [Venturia effusa]
MDVLRQSNALAETTTQNDKDKPEMTDEERTANIKLRATFAPALRNTLRTIGVKEPQPFLDEFDHLARLISPSQVEYLVVFLEGSLLPRCVALLYKYIRHKIEKLRHYNEMRYNEMHYNETSPVRRMSREWRPYERVIVFFTKLFSDLFEEIETYHRAGRTVDEVKIVELHLYFLVTLKTEMVRCHAHYTREYENDRTVLTQQALGTIEIYYPRFFRVSRGWIIHPNIGPRLVHAVQGMQLINLKNDISNRQILKAAAALEKDTTIAISGGDLKEFHIMVDNLIQSRIVSTMRTGITSYSLEREISRVISHYKNMSLIGASTENIPRCLGLDTRLNIDDYMTRRRKEEWDANDSGPPIDVSRKDRIKEMIEKGEHHCLVRKLCDLAIPCIVARCHGLIPAKVNYDVFHTVVLKVAESVGFELVTDESKECGFRLRRCPCWNGYRADD